VIVRLVAIAVAVAAMAAVGLAPGLAGATTRSQTTASEVTTEKNAKLGTILVAGNTVYTQKGKACTGACLKTWTPVVLPDGETAATAGSGVDESKLGTKTTASGATQITYGGKPLFWCTKDKAPGDVKGNVSDKFGKWSAVVVAKASGGGSTSTTNAGTGGAAF
jgi:predicted lipoprotein with Yx(FWY)xxD motif